MGCYAAKLRLLFYVMDLAEMCCQERAIDAEPSCQIGKGVSLAKAGFVAGSRFRRTLFQGEVAWVAYLFARIPGGEFVLSDLPALYLA